MITSKSPRKVLKLAHRLAQQVLPRYASHFSRKDFTRAQLFACLVLREHQRKSYRGIEALLADSPTWLADIALKKAPDHNKNLTLAKRDMNVRAIIPPRSGRPTTKPPPTEQPLRRKMYRRFAGQLDREAYGQRWQIETVNSMIKRNLGSALRARTAVRRRHELLLRVLTHNVMLMAE